MYLNLAKLLQFGKADQVAVAEMHVMIMMMEITGKMLEIMTQMLAGASVDLDME